MNMYVGNLSFETTEAELQQAFEEFGEVSSAKIIKDKFTGRSRGFGFVEMADNGASQAAMDGLNGKEMNGRAIVVNEAKPRNDSRGGGGGGGGGRRSW
jgi:cold-inducible RNA-binding protein